MLITEFVKDSGIDKYYKSPRYLKFSLLANYIKLVLEGEWIGDIKPISDDFSTVSIISQHFTLLPNNSALRLGDVYIILSPKRYRYGVFIGESSVIEQTSHLDPRHTLQTQNIRTELDAALARGYQIRILRPINTKNVTPADLIDFQTWLLDYFDGIDVGQANYLPPTYAQRILFLTALRSITSQAGAPYLDIDITAAKALLDVYDYEVAKGHDTINIKPFIVIYPKNPMNTPYNWGLYRMNIDEGFTTLITAPHPRTDLHSEILVTIVNSMRSGQLMGISTCVRSTTDASRAAIKVASTVVSGTWKFTFRGVDSAALQYNATAAQVFAAAEAMTSIGEGNISVALTSANGTGGVILTLDRELMLSTGSQTDVITVTSISLSGGGGITVNHDADHARNPNSMFHWVTKEYQDSSSTSNMQIHGFDDDNRGVDVVLSSARTIPAVLYRDILHSLRGYGYDVLARLDGGTQTLVFSDTVTGGTFTLTFNNQVTTAITYSTVTATTIANIKAALEDLSSVGLRNVDVKLSKTEVDEDGKVIYVVKFINDVIENSVEERMLIDYTNLTGTAITAEVKNGSNVVLAALTNTSGEVAKVNNGQFTHIEVAEYIRNDLTLLRELGVVIGSIDTSLLSSRSVPLVTRNKFVPDQIITPTSLAQTIGDSRVAANIEHAHPWTPSDAIAGNNYIATRNSINDGNSWRSPSQLRSLIGGYHVTDIDALGHQIFTAPLSTVFSSSTARLIHGVRLRVPSFPAAQTYTKARWYLAQNAIGHTGGRLAVYQNGVLLFQETLTGGSSIGSTGFKEVTFTIPFTPTTGISLDIFIYAYGGTPSQLPKLGITGNSAAVNAGNTGSGSYFFTSSDTLGATSPSVTPTKTAIDESVWFALV